MSSRILKYSLLNALYFFLLHFNKLINAAELIFMYGVYFPYRDLIMPAQFIEKSFLSLLFYRVLFITYKMCSFFFFLFYLSICLSFYQYHSVWVDKALKEVFGYGWESVPFLLFLFFFLFLDFFSCSWLFAFPNI